MRPLRLLFALPAFALLAWAAVPVVAQDDPVEQPPTQEGADEAAELAAPDERGAVAEAARALDATRPTLERAFERLGARDWEGAVAPFREVAAALEPHPLLGGLRDQCLYNVACALARTDRPDEAVAAFAASVEHGLRPIATPTTDGRIVLGPGLSFAHVLADPDLDSLRDLEAFRAVLDGLLRAGEPRVEPTAAAEGDGPFPAVIVLLPEGEHVEAGAAPWRDVLDDTPAVVALVAGPVRPSPSSRRWLLVDGDDRFGVEKVTAALDMLHADPRVDPSRVHLVALTSGGGEVALSAALARPGDVAGLALGPFRFHAAWHADALHGLAAAREGAAPWTISLVTPDESLIDALASAGVRVDRRDPPPTIVAPDARGAALRQTIVDGLRDLLR